MSNLYNSSPGDPGGNPKRFRVRATSPEGALVQTDLKVGDRYEIVELTVSPTSNETEWFVDVKLKKLKG